MAGSALTADYRTREGAKSPRQKSAQKTGSSGPPAGQAESIDQHIIRLDHLLAAFIGRLHDGQFDARAVTGIKQVSAELRMLERHRLETRERENQLVPKERHERVVTTFARIVVEENQAFAPRLPETIEAAACGVADNQATRLSDVDPTRLGMVLQTIKGDDDELLGLIGYTEREVDALISSMASDLITALGERYHQAPSFLQGVQSADPEHAYTAVTVPDYLEKLKGRRAEILLGAVISTIADRSAHLRRHAGDLEAARVEQLFHSALAAKDFRAAIEVYWELIALADASPAAIRDDRDTCRDRLLV